MRGLLVWALLALLFLATTSPVHGSAETPEEPVTDPEATDTAIAFAAVADPNTQAVAEPVLETVAGTAEDDRTAMAAQVEKALPPPANETGRDLLADEGADDEQQGTPAAGDPDDEGADRSDKRTERTDEDLADEAAETIQIIAANAEGAHAFPAIERPAIPELEHFSFTPAADETDPPARAIPSHAAPRPASKDVAAGPAAPDAVAVVAVAAMAMAATTMAGSTNAAPLLRPVRHWAHLVWAGLYARVTKDRVLDHETRQTILDCLRARPGACVREVQEVLGVASSTAGHHLRTLESNGLVLSLKNGRRRCYFVTDQRRPLEELAAEATLGSEAARRVYALIRRTPGIRQQELAARLGVTPTSVLFHGRRLEEAGVVERRRCGREMAYFPSR